MPEIKFKCYSCAGETSKVIQPKKPSFPKRFWLWFDGKPIVSEEPYGKKFLFECKECGRGNIVIPRRNS